MIDNERMNPLAAHFRTMAFNNQWSNHRLFSAVAKLSEEEFHAPRVGFFPSLHETLNHLLTVDWFYVDALERTLRGEAPHDDPYSFFEPSEPFATFAPLHAEQTAIDRRLVAVCENLEDAALEATVLLKRRSGTVADPVHRILAHLFTHQIHHRGQAHGMLSSTNVKPPQLDDFFCTNDAPIRKEDFAELGITEEEVWRGFQAV